jgi:hypothetical protein
MSAEVWSAILNPSGPNYSNWRGILGSEKVPLKSARSFLVEVGTEKDVEVYMLDLSALTLPQRSCLLVSVARRFGVTVYEIEAEISKVGFPIRAADVIVSYDMRAFV